MVTPFVTDRIGFSSRSPLPQPPFSLRTLSQMSGISVFSRYSISHLGHLLKYIATQLIIFFIFFEKPTDLQSAGLPEPSRHKGLKWQAQSKQCSDFGGWVIQHKNCFQSAIKCYIRPVDSEFYSGQETNTQTHTHRRWVILGLPRASSGRQLSLEPLVLSQYTGSY